jgi:hypothetical protein
MKVIFIFLTLIISVGNFAQNNVGIGTLNPNPQAKLDVTSDGKGVLIPSFTTLDRSNLATSLTNLEDGMLVYDEELSVFFYWDGPNLQWTTIGSSNIDSWGTQVVQTLGGNLSGDGTIINPIDLTEVDSNIVNEIQRLELNNDSLTLTKDTNSIDLGIYKDNTDLQTLSINGTVISIGNGNNITLPIVEYPTGAIMPFNLATCPTGWTTANGTNSTPDLRGEFVRGIDNGRGVDAGRVLASSQSDETKSHNHSTIEMIGNNNIDGVDSATTHSGEHHNEARQTGASGGNETRPRNAALLYCSKL